MPDEQTFELIFCHAIEIEDRHEREAHLAKECGDDVELRAQVERLVEAHFSAGSFLSKPFDPDGGRTELHQFRGAEGASAIVEGPGSQIGRYKLLQQIGEGGMGVVYMAEQIEPVRRQVALKIIKAGMDSRQVIARFEAERQALALMDHNHIARVLDAGTTDHGLPYFVMELVKGVPITEYCDQNRLTPRERLELFIPVCHAIQHAHQKEIIHRDIKPSNVLVTLYDGRPVSKVIDFGIAKATQQRLTERTMFTELGQIVGTMEYMSPEQAEMNQLDVDTRSDVYSLGVLLYELLTGTTPITKEQLREAGYADMLRTIREVEPPKPSTRLSESGEALPSLSAVRKTEPAKLSRLLRGDLDWIVMKSLEKDRTRRYETANGMAADIDRFLREEAIEARPPSASYKLRKFAHRNKAILATFFVIAATLLIASVISTVSAIRATRAERLASDRLIQVEQQRNETELARQEAVENEQQAEMSRGVAENQRNEAIWNQYVARQFPIIDAWKRRDFGHLERMVDDLSPKDGQPDFRGWEWTYFKDQCDETFFRIHGETPAWNPKKLEVAIVTGPIGDMRIEYWSPSTRQRIRVFPVPSGADDNRSAGLRWTRDGTQLACGWRSGRVVVIDSQTGAVLFVHSAKDQDMKSFDISGDGKLLATCNWYGRIEIWDVETGKSVRVLHEPEGQSNLYSIAFNASAKQLAASLRFGRRTTWNVDTGDSFEYTPESNGSGHVAWNAAGTHFASVEGGEVAIYELDKKDAIATLAHRGAVSMRWLGEDRIVTAGKDHTIRIWDGEQFSLLSELHLHSAPVTDLVESHNTEFLASWSWLRREARVSRLSQSHRQAAVFMPEVPRVGSIHLLSWEKSGRFLASGHLETHGVNDSRTSLRIWDVGSQELVQSENIDTFRSLAWSRDQQAVWATTLRGSFHQLDLETGKLNILESYAEDTNNSMSSFSPDGKWLALGDQDQAKLIDTSSMEVVRNVKLPTSAWSIKWSNDSKKVAIGAWAQLIIWDPFAGKVLGRKTTDNYPKISSITWHSEEWGLALGCVDGTIRIVVTDTLEDICVLSGHTGDVTGIDWAGNGRRIASTSDDGTIRIWDAATGDQLLAFHHPDELAFFSTAWSPDSRRLAGGDSHGGVFVWGSDQIKPLPPLAKGLATGVISRHPVSE